MVTVTTPLGPVRFKVARRDGRVLNAQPEFDDLAKLSSGARHPNQGRPGAGAQGVARTMKLFPDHRDRFRQQPAAPRHGLRKDHGRRHRPLPPARGVRHPFPDGQRRALAERVPQGAPEQGKDPLAYCDEMEQVFRDVWKRLDVSFDDFIRTTDRKRHFPGGPEDGAGLSATTATSTKASTRAGTASAARRSSRRRISSTASVRSTRPSRSGSRRRTGSSGCRSISSRC